MRLDMDQRLRRTNGRQQRLEHVRPRQRISLLAGFLHAGSGRMHWWLMRRAYGTDLAARAQLLSQAVRANWEGYRHREWHNIAQNHIRERKEQASRENPCTRACPAFILRLRACVRACVRTFGTVHGCVRTHVHVCHCSYRTSPIPNVMRIMMRPAVAHCLGRMLLLLDVVSRALSAARCRSVSARLPARSRAGQPLRHTTKYSERMGSAASTESTPIRTHLRCPPLRRQLARLAEVSPGLADGCKARPWPIESPALTVWVVPKHCARRSNK